MWQSAASRSGIGRRSPRRSTVRPAVLTFLQHQGFPMPRPPRCPDTGRETHGPHCRGRRSGDRALRDRTDTPRLRHRRLVHHRSSRRHRQVRPPQARFGGRRTARRGQGRRREERHADDRDRARPDRAGRRAVGRGQGRLRRPYLRQARVCPGHRPRGQGGFGLAAAAKLSSVQGIDLRDEIRLEDPSPGADHAKGASAKATSGTHPGPDENTPAKNLTTRPSKRAPSIS